MLYLKKCHACTHTPPHSGSHSSSRHQFGDHSEEAHAAGWEVFTKVFKSNDGTLDREQVRYEIAEILMNDSMEDEAVDALFERSVSGDCIDFQSMCKIFQEINARDIPGKHRMGIGNADDYKTWAMQLPENTTKWLTAEQYNPVAIAMLSLKAANYSEEHIDGICRIMFVVQKQPDLEKVYEIVGRN